MIEVIVLASGSSGNVALVRCGGRTVLIDAGLSGRRLCSLLDVHQTPLESLDGILLTHEHGDHARGLKVLAAKHNVPVFANAMTARALQQSGVAASWNIFQSGSVFEIAGMTVRPFSVPHDAADPVGFVLNDASSSFAVLTDLGYATRSVLENVRGVSSLLIETNHEESLLQGDTKRPWSVKQRILSRHGHLSNAAAAEIVREVSTENLRHVVLGHLSRDCNSTEHARRAVAPVLAPHVLLHCAAPDEEAAPVCFTV